MHDEGRHHAVEKQTLPNTKRYPRKICERENDRLKFSYFNALTAFSVARRKIFTRNINGLFALYVARRIAFASNINELSYFYLARGKPLGVISIACAGLQSRDCNERAGPNQKNLKATDIARFLREQYQSLVQV